MVIADVQRSADTCIDWLVSGIAQLQTYTVPRHQLVETTPPYRAPLRRREIISKEGNHFAYGE